MFALFVFLFSVQCLLSLRCIGLDSAIKIHGYIFVDGTLQPEECASFMYICFREMYLSVSFKRASEIAFLYSGTFDYHTNPMLIFSLILTSSEP